MTSTMLIQVIVYNNASQSRGEFNTLADARAALVIHLSEALRMDRMAVHSVGEVMGPSARVRSVFWTGGTVICRDNMLTDVFMSVAFMSASCAINVRRGVVMDIAAVIALAFPTGIGVTVLSGTDS